MDEANDLRWFFNDDGSWSLLPHNRVAETPIPQELQSLINMGMMTEEGARRSLMTQEGDIEDENDWLEEEEDEYVEEEPELDEEQEEILLGMGFYSTQLPDGTTHWRLREPELWGQAARNEEQREELVEEMATQHPFDPEEGEEMEEESYYPTPFYLGGEITGDNSIRLDTTPDTAWGTFELEPFSNELHINLDRILGGNDVEFVVLSHKGREWRIPLRQALTRPQLPHPGGD